MIFTQKQFFLRRIPKTSKTSEGMIYNLTIDGVITLTIVQKSHYV